MAMNTTKSMERTSTVLASKCAETEKNLDKLMADAGCAKYEAEAVTLPMAPGSKDDVMFVGLNGVSFYFLRGKKVNMPKPLLEILKNTGEM